MKKTLLFSDVHLKAVPDDRPRHAQFAALLRAVSPDEFDRVICLGDLFDFWFEYRTVIFSDFFEILCAFRKLREDGIEVHLACGNHDFWGGRFLVDELGIIVHEGDFVLDFGDKKALLGHGDGINPADWMYRFYKRFARHPLIVGAFRFIHPDYAMALARLVSHGSRTYLGVENPPEGPEAKALRAHALRLLEEGETDIVGLGHSHAPCIETALGSHGEGVYINTGDWVNNRSYIVWDGAEFSLHSADKAE